MSGIPHIYGAAAFSPERKFKTVEDAGRVLDVLAQHHVRHLDTAQVYGQSEKVLGELDAGSRFSISTKAAGGMSPGSLEHRKLVDGARQSLQRLQVSSVDVFYLHAPDATVPLESTLAGVQELYLSGAFTRFGLSNYLPADVEAIHRLCSKRGWILPTIYQGSFNPVARHSESELLPLLRELKIAFYAYGPQAGGFLAKSENEVLEGKGRLDPSNRGGQMLRRLYCKPSLLRVLDIWNSIATEAGCSKSELACRWVKHNKSLDAELGDCMIFSSSTLDQTTDLLRSLTKGPLPNDIINKIDALWCVVKAEAPVDNING